MTRNTSEPIKVIMDIKPGTGTPAQQKAWRRFWQKLTAKAQTEVKSGT
jgi:hypothetical protein